MTTAYLLLGNDKSLETPAGLPIGKIFAYKEMEKLWLKKSSSDSWQWHSTSKNIFVRITDEKKWNNWLYLLLSRAQTSSERA